MLVCLEKIQVAQNGWSIKAGLGESNNVCRGNYIPHRGIERLLTQTSASRGTEHYGVRESLKTVSKEVH